MKTSLIVALLLLLPNALSAAVIDTKNLPCPNPGEVRDGTGQCVRMFFDTSSPSGASSGETSNTEVRERSGAIQNPLEADSLLELLMALLKGVVRLGLIGLVLALMWSGFQFVTAQGNEEKIRSARTTLLWTVVGGAVLLGAELIANLVIATVQSLS